MEEIGIVSKVEGVHATVTVTKKSVCEHCTAGTCHLTEDGAVIEAVNDARAEVGQRVRVVLREHVYVKGSLMLWGLPALAIIVGAVAGKAYLSGFFPSVDPDGVSAVTAAVLFAVSLLVIKLWSKRAEKQTEYQPIVQEILEDIPQ
jgi:sigma-E factor negative regulatory protein RseC